jgi:hypothetical protein
VLGHSQLAGSPGIPSWGIPLPQYPSVSLLSWQTGYGNARYWVLKLLLTHFAPGDSIFNTTVSSGTPPGGANPFCGEVDGPAYGTTTLYCIDPAATINGIQFADWGTPNGLCGNFSKSTACTCPQTLAYVQAQCVGKNSCALTPYPTLGDPCYQVVKRFVVQASCTGTKGGASSSSGSAEPVYALGIQKAGSGAKKILLINKTFQPQTVTLSVTTLTGVLSVVDETTGPASSPAGIANSPFAGSQVVLNPYATAILTLD